METIVIKQPNGFLSTTKCADGIDVLEHAKQIANGNPYHIVKDTSLPTEFEFREAWTVSKNGVVSTNLAKAKAIAHDVRRQVRDALFVPLDRKATVPALLTQVEVERQAIRDADAVKQTAIDNAKNIAELLVAYHA